MNSIIHCEKLHKTFHDTAENITILNNIHFSIKPGDRVAIIGPSGAGKSTLLHILGGLEPPTSGSISLMGQSWGLLSEQKRCELRNQHLGFVYQFHHLLPEFTAFENVAMPLLLANDSFNNIEKRVTTLLKKVGLSKRMHHKPAHLSGGERQRVAIARALIHQPDCVLADEPTGNLDTETAASVFQLMLDLNTEVNTALLIVTHDLTLAKKMDRCFKLSAGRLTKTIL